MRTNNSFSKAMIAMIVSAMLFMILAVSASAQIATFPQITVTLINNEPDPVAPGNTVEMRFRVENEGTVAENVEAKLVLKYPFTIYGDEETKSLGTIAGNQLGDLGVKEKWKLLVDQGATTGDHTVEFWYRVNKGTWTKAGDYTITIRSRDAVLAINEIKTEKENIVPGTKAKVYFVLQNLADNTLTDIKLNLAIYSAVTTTTSVTYFELPFTPIGSGNEKTLQRLGSREKAEIVFDLFTDADAESKVYKVPYTLTYSDASGTNFSRTGVLGLVVESTPDLSVNLESTEIYSAGAKGKIDIKLVNKGFSDIKFLDIVLPDSDSFEVISNHEVYIGKLDSDDYETATFTIMVSKNAKDHIILPLKINYRDANGKLYTREEPVELKLYQGAELKQRTNGKGFPWGSIVVILIIVGVGFYIYKRRKNRKRKA